jgi:hypothetical protein
MAKSKAKATKDAFVLPMDKEDDSGGGRKITAKVGDHPVKITKVRPVNAKDKGTPGIEFTFKVTKGKSKNKVITDTLWLTPKALPRFRTLFSAFGVKLPKTAKKIPYKKVVGRELVVTVEMGEPNDDGKTYPEVPWDGFMSLEDFESGGVDDDDDEDLDADDDDDEDEDDDDLDLDEDDDDDDI